MIESRREWAFREYVEWLQGKRDQFAKERDECEDPRRAFCDGAFGAYDLALVRAKAIGQERADPSEL